jgi:hypothetical protein
VRTIPVGSLLTLLDLSNGVNEVHITWTTDQNMDRRYDAKLLIERKVGGQWSLVITREVNWNTKPGETTSRITTPP